MKVALTPYGRVMARRMHALAEAKGDCTCVPGIYPRLLRPIGSLREYTRDSCVRLVRRENVPASPASGWFVVRIHSRFLRPIGSS
eukprot:356766-Prorocentrum_minimum.AAC.1